MLYEEAIQALQWSFILIALWGFLTICFPFLFTTHNKNRNLINYRGKYGDRIYVEREKRDFCLIMLSKDLIFAEIIKY